MGKRRVWGWLHCLQSIRPISVLLLVSLLLTQIPVVSAHGSAGSSGLTHIHGLLLGLAGIGLGGGAIVFKRLGRISPTVALYGVLVGIGVIAVGAILFEGLSPERTYSANSMPFPRPWYQPLALTIGFLITVGSFIIGRFRWPIRPRYTFLGMLMGLWIAYPSLIPGAASDSHPLGYAIVLGTPVLVGYIIWKDRGSILRVILRDRVARRFGVGGGIIVALFFVSVTGYLSFFPEDGLPNETTVVVLSSIFQLVTWPILEINIPDIPFFVAISPGQLIVVGLLSTLIGLNATFVARRWRADQQAGMTEGTVGSAALVGSCTCGCCGPLVAKVAVLAAGPSLTAPLYWVFVDTASPLSALFIVASILLFVGSLVYSVETTRQSNRSMSIVSAD